MCPFKLQAWSEPAAWRTSSLPDAEAVTVVIARVWQGLSSREAPARIPDPGSAHTFHCCVVLREEAQLKLYRKSAGVPLVERTPAAVGRGVFRISPRNQRASVQDGLSPEPSGDGALHWTPKYSRLIHFDAAAGTKKEGLSP